MNPVLFFALAIIAVSGALGVVVARNPVHSALFLVMTMVTMAGFFLGLDAPLVAAVQIVVYASAIVVLFLFVIMLLGSDRGEPAFSREHTFQRPVALIAGVGSLVALLVLTLGHWQTGAHTAGGYAIHGVPTVDGKPVPGAPATDAIRPLARVLFTRFAWPFEVTAVLLVVAVVGAVVLARRSQRPRRTETTA
ncbi:MAG TPA: NADH-quinone oxidoreductase subunit J [Acidimicrobiia bacterium]